MSGVLEAITVQVDESGHIVLPPLIREHMQIEAGTTLLVEKTGEDEVRLRVIKKTAPLVCEDGLLVIQAEPIGDIDNAVANEREARLASFLEGVRTS